VAPQRAVVISGGVMTMDAWMIWIVVAVVLAAAELAWPNLLLAPFAAGALLGAVSESAGFGSAAHRLGQTQRRDVDRARVGRG
jgi:hypothetical protein